MSEECLYSPSAISVLTNAVNSVSADTADIRISINNTVETDLVIIKEKCDTIIAKIDSARAAVETKLDSLIYNQGQNQTSLVNILGSIATNIISVMNSQTDNQNELKAKVAEVKSQAERTAEELSMHRVDDVKTMTDKTQEVKTETSLISMALEMIRNADIPAVFSAVENAKQQTQIAITTAKMETLNSQSELSNDIITIINQIKDKLIELFDYVDDFDEGYNIGINEGAAEQERVREQFETQFNQYCIDNFGEVVPFPIEPPPRRPGKVIPIKPPIPGGIGKKIGWIIGIIEQLTDLQLYLQLVDTWGTIRMGGRTFGNEDNSNLLEMLYRSLGMKDYVSKGWDLLPTTQQFTRYDFLKDGGLKEQIRVNKEGKVEWNGWLKMKTASGKDIYLTGALIDCLATVADLAWMTNNNK